MKKIIDNNLSETFETFVRPCLIGELFIYGAFSCELCPKGQFSLDDPMTKDFTLQNCRECPENAICLSGNSITPKKGYWRAHENSSKIIECFVSEACLGNSASPEKHSALEG